MNRYIYDSKSKKWTAYQTYYEMASKKQIKNEYPLSLDAIKLAFNLWFDMELKPDIVAFGEYPLLEKYSWGESKQDYRITIKDPLSGKITIKRFPAIIGDPLGTNAAKAFLIERYTQNLEYRDNIVHPEDFIAW